MTSLLTAPLVRLDAALGASAAEVIRGLARLVVDAGRATDLEGLVTDAIARETTSSTGLPGGIAIPHCRSAHVTAPTLAFARLRPPVDFGAADGPADLVFLIAAPDGAGKEHLKLLSALARALVRPAFTTALREAADDDAVVALVAEVLAPRATPAAEPVAEPAAAAAAPPQTLVAVTACPTGIAHTYMAADSLVAAGVRAGVTVHVETQGSSGATPLAPEVIAAAAAVVFATDVGVREPERFAGKPVVASGVKRAINSPDAMIAEALAAAADPSAARVDGTAAVPVAAGAGRVSKGVRLRQILLTGVSYMIPFVAAGGLLIALGFLLAGYQVTDVADSVVLDNSLGNLPDGGLSAYLGAVLFKLGALAFGFLVPALAGYIAFAIADRPGLAPGFTAGAIAGFVGAGFLGGLVGGLVAGFAALWISRWRVPTWARGLMPVAVVPLLATLVAGGLMLLVLGRPLAAITTSLQDGLNSLTGTSVVLLGIILGLMMAFDLGGPVNKAAYAFATAGLSVDNPASLRVMAAVMAAGMVPPLALALATAVRPRLFSPAEQENGKAAWLLGAAFISEGAIPFAAADPLRVIPPVMLGAATTGGIVMATGTTLSAPHGGIFVFFAVGGIPGFLLALAVGTAVGGAAVLTAKGIGRSPAAPSPQAALVPA